MEIYGKEIYTLNIEVMELCNLLCKGCHPLVEKCSEYSQYQLSNEEIYFLTKQLVKLGVHDIVLVGGEPLLRPGLLSLLHNLRFIKGINGLRVVTNGSLLKSHGRKLKEAGITAVHVALPTLKPLLYKTWCGGSLHKVLQGIESALHDEVPIVLDVTLMKGINDNEILDLVKFAEEKEVPIRFLEYGNQEGKEKYFMSVSEVLEVIPTLKRVEEDKEVYQLAKGISKISLISQNYRKYNYSDPALRLTHRGELVLEGNRKVGIDTSHLLKDEISLYQTLQQMVLFQTIPSQFTENMRSLGRQDVKISDMITCR